MPHGHTHTAWRAIGFAGLAAGLALLAACGASTTPGGSSGQVTIITDQPRYGASDTVHATVTNGLASSVLTADHQSNCGIVTIERQEGQTWQPQNPCLLKTATRLITLAPGSVTTAPLQPPTAAGASGWTAGTYRVAFTYRLSQAGSDTTIYSAQFSIG